MASTNRPNCDDKGGRRRPSVVIKCAHPHLSPRRGEVWVAVGEKCVKKVKDVRAGTVRNEGGAKQRAGFPDISWVGGVGEEGSVRE